MRDLDQIFNDSAHRHDGVVVTNLTVHREPLSLTCLKVTEKNGGEKNMRKHHLRKAEKWIVEKIKVDGYYQPYIPGQRIFDALKSLEKHEIVEFERGRGYVLIQRG